MIAFVTDHKFILSADGIRSNRFDNETISKYAKSGDGLYVLGRKVESNDNGHSITTEDVYFELTNSKFKAILRCLRNLKLSIIVIRLPSIYGYIQGLICILFNKNYFVELVGDPYDSIVYSTDKKLHATISSIFCKFIVQRSSKTSYVNKSKLPFKYPTQGKSYILSNVVLKPQRFSKKTNEINRIGFIGSLESKYKGLGDLINVLIELRFNGVLDIIGEGKLKNQYISQLTKSNINFEISDYYSDSSEYIKHIRRFDLYVMSSYTEGLSRTLLDCMNQGVLCVSSDAGGSSEILPEYLIWKVGDLSSMKNVILTTLNFSTVNISKEVNKNLRICTSFYSENLWKIREKFLSID